MRCVHSISLRNDRCLSDWRVFRGPCIIHRRWDRRALREIGPEDATFDMIAFRGTVLGDGSDERRALLF
ncbi:hypothetical protein SAMN04488125_1289 [Methylorubrum salsuginis]|uniref:Uncharacterized protein n=1 Tax=Methylorubrum salsuginis TaxID=414703 RepID=A0A1I4L7A1_9HYPH|nr:hypothetical protein SAMN04488125_1289 [Methylorubrum salsuginis]